MLEAKADLTRLQEMGSLSPVDPNLVLLEKGALIKYVNLSCAEESFKKQKAIIGI